MANTTSKLSIQSRIKGGSTDSEKSQRDRFIEVARELGCDEDEAAFKEKLAVIARQKPKDEKPEPPTDSEQK